MSDLAQEASISRQTLYNSYENKDDVLKALIRSYIEGALCKVETRLEGVQGLGAQLDIVFDEMSVAGFDFIQATPNAQDIIDGFNATGREEIDAGSEKFRVVIERLLAPHQDVIRRGGLDLVDLSYFVLRSAKGASERASNREDLLRHLKTLKLLCLAAAGD